MTDLRYDIELSDEDKNQVFKKPLIVGRCSYRKCGIKIYLDQNDGYYRHFNDGGGIAIKKRENYFCSAEHLMQYLDDIHNKENVPFILNMKGGKKKTNKRKFRKKRKTKKRKNKKRKIKNLKKKK